MAFSLHVLEVPLSPSALPISPGRLLSMACQETEKESINNDVHSISRKERGHHGELWAGDAGGQWTEDAGISGLGMLGYSVLECWGTVCLEFWGMVT